MFIHFLIIIFNLFDFTSCKSNNNFNNDLLYNHLVNKKYNFAQEELNKINEDYIFNNDLKEYLVKKMFINYKLNNLKIADKILDKLLILYKNDNNFDYILYMKGLINLKMNENNLSFFLSYNYFNKNHELMSKSLYYFSNLVNNYKNSKYYKDSIYKIIYIKQRLFVYNLSILDFYFKKNNHISVINRSIDLLKFFPEEPYIYYLIKYIEKSCKILSLDEIKKEIDIIINNNLSKFNKLKIKFN